MAKPLLEFDHVHTYYGEIHILDDVSLPSLIHI